MTLHESFQQVEKAVRNDTGRKIDADIIKLRALELVQAATQEGADRALKDAEATKAQARAFKELLAQV